MRNNRRRDKSSSAYELPLLDCNGFHVCYIGRREAIGGLVDGTYRANYTPYKLGTPVHKRELSSVQLRSARQDMLKVKPPITRGEAAAAIGLHGESHTIRLSEQHKALRVQRIRDEQHRIVPMEDHIESAMIKIAFYPVVGDENNPATVGPVVDHNALRQFVSV